MRIFNKFYNSVMHDAYEMHDEILCVNNEFVGKLRRRVYTKRIVLRSAADPHMFSHQPVSCYLDDSEGRVLRILVLAFSPMLERSSEDKMLAANNPTPPIYSLVVTDSCKIKAENTVLHIVIVANMGCATAVATFSWPSAWNREAKIPDTRLENAR